MKVRGKSGEETVDKVCEGAKRGWREREGGVSENNPEREFCGHVGNRRDVISRESTQWRSIG